MTIMTAAITMKKETNTIPIKITVSILRESNVGVLAAVVILRVIMPSVVILPSVILMLSVSIHEGDQLVSVKVICMQ